MIGDILKEAREGKRLTLSGVAGLAGVTPGYVSNLEKGRAEPSLSMLRKLAEILDIPAYLLFRDETEGAIVVKKSERAMIRFKNIPGVCEMATPALWNVADYPDTDAIQVHASPGFRAGAEDLSSGADLCLYMLEGKMEYEDGGEKTELFSGAGVYMPRRTPFHLENVSGEDASFVWLAKRGPVGARANRANSAVPGTPDGSRLRLIGEKIKELRKRQGLGLNALAKMTGVSAAHVSQIENNLAEPSLPVLRSIAKALGVELVLLFAGEAPTQTYITYPETRPIVTIPGGNAKFQLLMPFITAEGRTPDLSAVIADLAPGVYDSPTFVEHGYSELCIALKGSVEYLTDAGSYVLSEGDSLFLKKNTKHSVHNPGEDDARMLAVFGNVFTRLPGFPEAE
ncbi:MAG: helix-turn-helix domain-containing protein [Clostridiales bacterium]|nr:helix-turn-helix domain-containing protein [Clostridiales bacterium]